MDSVIFYLLLLEQLRYHFMDVLGLSIYIEKMWYNFQNSE